MGLFSGVSWCHASQGFWRGCKRKSPGCFNCYMFRELRRYGQDPDTVTRAAPPTFNAPLSVYGPRSSKGQPGAWKWADGLRVFVCPHSDFFHPAADDWRAEAWEVMELRPGLTWQIVTKRPELAGDRLPIGWGAGWAQVWLISTTENQDTLNERWAAMRRIPAAVYGLSVAPMLGPVSLREAGIGPGDVQWVIVEGEGGARNDAPAGAPPCRGQARRCDLTWIRALVAEAQALGAQVYVKQLGDNTAVGGVPLHAVGFPQRDISRREVSLWPADLRIQAYPAAYYDQARRFGVQP